MLALLSSVPRPVMSQDDTSYTLPVPGTDQAFMNVSALEAGNLVIPAFFLISGCQREDVIDCPSLAFLLRHSKTGSLVVFDLGIRRDLDSLAPAAKAFAFKAVGEGGMNIKTCVKQTASESLIKGGVSPDQIDAVIVSHLHWDHIGDASPFKNATFVVGKGGKDLLTSGYPTTEDSQFLADSIPVVRTRFLGPSDFSTSIGPFPHALDYFGDGSLYVIDAPGHLAGHVNVLARTSSNGSWIYFGGDSAHHFGLITGEKCIPYRINNAGHINCAHANKEVAEETIGRIGKLLEIPKVQVLIAHDVEWYNANKGGSAFFPGTIPPLP